MNKILIVVLILLILGGGAWFLMSKSTPRESLVPVTPGTEEKTVTPATTGDIVIEGSKYSPSTLTVKAGAKVTVVNKDFSGHSVTSEDGLFDTGVLGQNATGSFTAPTTPGEYKFHCTPHPSIMGVLVVE